MNTVSPLEKYWGWVFVVGFAIASLGAFALVMPFVVTITSVKVFGWLLVAAGVIQLLFGFTFRHSHPLFMQSFNSLLMILIGILIAVHPEATAAALTLLLALLFLGSGVFRMYSAVAWPSARGIWMFIGGLISFILGLLILIHWPSSALWVIGVFIGIDLIFVGWSLILGSLMTKKTSTPG